MSSIAGLISQANEEVTLQRMLDKLKHYNYRLEKLIGQGVYFGWTGNENSSEVLLTKEQERYYVIFKGEIFNYRGKGLDKIDNYSQLFLDLWLERGPQGFVNLNGQFCGAVYDSCQKELVIVTDRFGTHPIFYCKMINRIIFSSEAKSIISCDIDESINYKGISDLFHFGHIFGYDTLFESVHQIPEASCVIFHEKSTEHIKYWDYPYQQSIYFRNKISKKNEQRYVEELKHLMIQSVKRQTHNETDRLLFPLSGGLDSRWILGVSNYLRINPLVTYTMGEKTSEDIIYATKVAEKLNTEHYTFTIDPTEIWKNAEKFSWISDGMSMIYGPIQSFTPVMFFKDKRNVIVASQMCDAIFGSTLARKRIKNLAGEKKLNMKSGSFLINIFNLFSDEILRRIFCKDYFNKIKDLYQETPSRYLSDNEAPIHIYYKLLMNEHGRRGTLGGNLVTNLFYRTRMPSYDYDLIEFAFNLPLGLRIDQYIYRRAFWEIFPELSKIPREGNNLPITAGKLKLRLMEYSNMIVKKLRNTPMEMILCRIPQLNRPAYVMYDKWFRKELKNRVEQFIFSKRLIERKIFKTDGLEDLFFEHFTGKFNHSHLIWQIINLEYFYRNYID
jgi:asparagine synthase (glutamine-hydrolysing)